MADSIKGKKLANEHKYLKLIITWYSINITMVAIILKGQPFHLAHRCTSQQQITLMKDSKNFNDTLRGLMNKISKMDISFISVNCNAKLKNQVCKCIQDKIYLSQVLADGYCCQVKVFNK